MRNLILAIAVASASAAKITTKSGDMLVQMEPGKSFSVQCPGDGNDAYATGRERGKGEAQAICDETVKEATEKASTAAAALVEANAANVAATASVEEKEKLIAAGDAKVEAQKKVLDEKTAALNVCKANEANCADDMPKWMTMTASLGSTNKAEQYVVSPGGGGKLAIGGIGFGTVFRELGSWNPELVECIFKPSDKGGNTVATPTEVVDGEFDGSKMLSCPVPPITDGKTAAVTLKWNGEGGSELSYRGIEGRNVLYSASWYSGIAIVDGIPTVTGVGFSAGGHYGCLYSIPGSSSFKDFVPATVVSATTLKCGVNLPKDGPIMKVYNANKNAQVIVQAQVSVDGGKKYQDLADDKPSSVPFKTGTSKGKPKMYKYIETACGDGNQAANEVGVDCGLDACGKQCEWNDGNMDQKSKKGEMCDVTDDCSGGGTLGCFDKVCKLAYFSCNDVDKVNKNAPDGLYTINKDKDVLNLDKEPESTGTVEVYCMRYDGHFWTLMEIVPKNAHANGKSPYNMCDKTSRHPSADARIGNYWKTNNKNVAARYEVPVFNSVFKHSKGMIMTFFANNAPEYHFTDVFGDPDSGVHLLDKSNRCSHRAQIDMGMAFRPRSNAVRGYCMKGGQIGASSNCFCGDAHSPRFNSCPGSPGNWVRYTGKKGNNKRCHSMAGKCNNGDSYHGFLGDSYGCNVNRNVQGHMWQGYGGRRGMPCSGYNSYGCSGSRWIA